jgi:flagellar hook-length control protein FliK
MTAVYKAGEKPSGRREPVKDPTQAAKLNQARVTTGQTPANAVAAESTGPAQILASATQQAAGQVSSGTPAKAGEVALQGTARGATQAEISQQAADVPVADQIVRSIRAADARIGRQITVQLAPPELGKVRITLRSSGQQIRGVIEADNPDTLRRLEREAVGLTQRLSDAGLEVRRLDVVLARQDGQAASENPLTRDGSGRHPGAQSEPAEHAETTRMESSEETTVAGTDTAVPGSINVRI